MRLLNEDLRRFIAVSLLVGTAMTLGATISMAQSVQDCTISGTVLLPTGDPVAGATARLTGTGIVAAERTVESGYAGRFVFLSVPPGTYSVTVGMEDFTTFVQENIVLMAGDRVFIRAPLEIAAIEGSVVVRSDLPVVDTQSSTIDTVFNEELLETVPTNRDAFYDLQLSAAGMAGIGSEESQFPSVSAYGGSQSDNIFLVNGVNTTDPRGAAWGSLVQVNYNNVQEVKVLSLGSKAEYGSFSGAAVDVITKSGSNEFHGDVAYYTQLGAAESEPSCLSCFGADWLWADADDELVAESQSDWEANLTMGGPIVRDRLWFHAGFVRQSVRTKKAYRTPIEGWDADLFDLKLTTELGHSHRAWIAYHHEDITTSNVTWGDWDESMVHYNDRPNDTLSAQYQWVATDRDIFGFKFLGFETSDQVRIDNELGYPGYQNWWKWTEGQGLGVGGDFPYVDANQSQRATVQADFSHYAEDFLGSHDLKFGVQYTRAESNHIGGFFHGYDNFAYPYPWTYGPAEDWSWNCHEEGCWGTPEDPVFPMSNVRNYSNPWLTVRHSESIGAFIDDTWVLSDRISLNLGLRFDRMTARYGEGATYENFETPADARNPTLLRTRDGTDDLFQFDTWSPRLGFVWTLTADGKTALRSNIGRYYAPMGLENLGNHGPGDEGWTTESWIYLLPMSEVDTNGDGHIHPNEVPGAMRLLGGRDPDLLEYRNEVVPLQPALPPFDPETSSPYTDQFHIAVERQLGRNASLELAYVYKHTRDLLIGQPYNRMTGEFWEWEPVPFTTWTGMETNLWQVVLEDYDGDGDVDWDDAMFVTDNTRYQVANADDFASLGGISADRTYHGLQLTFSKRYSNRWQMLASLNWSETEGFAQRVFNQNYFIDGPWVMGRPSGMSLNHFVNNTEGPLPMTPEWLLKVSGSYRIPVIETDFGFRLRYNSGRAVFPTQNFRAYEWWMWGFDGCPEEPCVVSPPYENTIVAGDPKDPDWLPSTTIVDLNLSKTFRLGKMGGLWVSLDVLNATDENAATSVNTGEEDYGRVYGLVLPRRYRLGLKFSF